MSLAIEVCFVVENQDFKVRGDKLAKTSTYYVELLETSKEFSEIRLLLPDWISVKPFQIYLSYIENSRIPKLDLIMAQKLLWLADFFKDTGLQENLISQQIVPYLNKETVLLFVQDACTKICSSDDTLKCWEELYSQACEFSAKNLRYLYEKFANVMNKLDVQALKMIFRIALTTRDSEFALDKLKEYKQAESYIDLLRILEKESLEAFNQDISKMLVLEWNIDDFEFSNFYKETEVFKIASTDWVLCLWCFEHEKRLEISIKQSEISKATKYNISVVTSIVQVQDEILETLTPQVFPIPDYTQSQCIIREITSFNPEHVKNFTIKFYAHSEYIVSNLLQKISSKPEVLLNSNIEEFPFSHISVLLNLKYLNVNCEDTALEILANWLQTTSYTLNEHELRNLSNSIRWEFTTIKGLITIVCNYPKLKSYQIFQNLIKKELENKGKKLSKDNPEARKTYKKYTVRESFQTQKEYLNMIFDSILTYNAVEKETNKVRELKDQLDYAQKEIAMLKSLRKEVLSPIPQIKVEEDISLNFTPVAMQNHITGNGNHAKSRKSSIDTAANKSIDLSMRLKNRKAGAAINDLVSKLRNGRRHHSELSGSK
ncbi:hypothetical protein SteCoe_36421 [Stentor coeruleus]|uniref:BTB domain-containing protein n=1 Tax=Stentor coeruleus TaxID=5963 RepID=A0A1R2AQ61_9CILI|nr:hypothetical protein SteCoe_36421 [Stentor coeruleus]